MKVWLSYKQFAKPEIGQMTEY